MERYVIFTDLDGTLLDHDTYSFAPAIPALRLIREKDIPLVICSSKTRSEIEGYRAQLDNRDPFIVENGGAVLIPAGFFVPAALHSVGLNVIAGEGYEVVRLGAAYRELRRAVCELREAGFNITGFGDMSAGEVAAVTGLSEEHAAKAMEREFDEPFLFEGNTDGERELEEAVRAKGFNLTRGRFFHILGESDKGTAVLILTALFRQKLGEICTVALGDSPNDLPMLERVDYPVLVKNPDGRHNPRMEVPGLIMADGVGPAGWNEVIIRLLAQSEKD